MSPIGSTHLRAPSTRLSTFMRNDLSSISSSLPIHGTRCYSSSRRAITTYTQSQGVATIRDYTSNSSRLPIAPVQSRSLSPLTASPRRTSLVNARAPLYQGQPFSTARILAWWGWWRSKRDPRGKKLPPLASFLDGSSPRLIFKATNEPRLRCTEFDENGNVTLVNGEFKKSELIAKYGLLPRDLRKIDSSLLPHILIRSSAILINLLHLRVLIKHNRVLVFDAYGSTDSYTQSVFMYDLEGKLRQMDTRANGALPYELRALEAVLISATNALESEFEGVRDPVVRVLRELEEDIDRDKLRYLLIYSKKLGTFEQTARLVRDALEEILEADDDLAAMYLSAKAQGKNRDENDHTEVELLLESYHKVTNEIVQAAENLVSNIRNTEEIIRAILDANRNSLMLLELRFSVWTLGLGAGTFVAALYGMNLKNFIEESDFGFWGISGICAVSSVFVLIYGLQRLRRVQRVSMWGDHHGTPAVPRNIVQPYGLQETREQILRERTPWGMGKNTAAKQAERAKMMGQHFKDNQFHPDGPLWAKVKEQELNHYHPQEHAAHTTSDTIPKGSSPKTG